MNLPKQFSYIAILLASTVSISAVGADKAKDKEHAAKDVVHLPVLTVMAEREMREETAVEPYQQETGRRKALQHRVMQLEGDTQSFTVDPTIVANLDVLPVPQVDMSSLSPALQQHVLNIASGLQSSDPRNGIYTMLQPFGIDRNAANVQISREQMNLGTVDRSLLNGMTNP